MHVRLSTAAPAPAQCRQAKRRCPPPPPPPLQAGKEVTIYYNPDNTNLHGRQAIWIK